MIHQYKWKTLLLLFAAFLPLSAAGIAAPVPQNIPLQNPGFEDGVGDWGTGYPGQISIETNNVHSGAQALKIDATQKHNMPFAGQTVSGLIGSATYQFSAWARVAPGSPSAIAGLKMENYNAAGKNTSGPYGQTTLPADGSWKQVSVTCQVDPDTTTSHLLLRVMSSGSIIFDDATFSLIKEPAEVTILSPLEQTFDPGMARRMQYQVYLSQPWTAAAPPQFTAILHSLTAPADDIKSIPASAVQGSDNRHFTVSFSMPGDQLDYEVNLAYQRDGQILRSDSPAYAFITLIRAHRKPQNLMDNGTILHNGKPFFPIGIYHPGGPGEYKLLADNGFNAIQGAASTNLDAMQQYFDAAQQYGLVADVPLYINGQVAKNLGNSLAIIKRFANHPAILDWKIIDEPDLRPAIAPEVPPVYRALKAADPNNPLELTVSGSGSPEYWGNFCDIVQVDVYPFPNSPLTQVSDRALGTQKAMQPWQNLSVVVQSGWVADLSNQPSAAQARSMVYLALIGGAKGIWWYSMHESTGWDLSKTPLWPHIKEINAEIKALSEPLMLGKVVEGINCSQPKVLFRAVEYQNKIYLLVTNPQNTPVQATFTLPANLRSYGLMDSGNKSELKGSQMTLSLQGVGSCTYVLEK